MIYSDAHIHCADIQNWKPLQDFSGKFSPVCTCAHTPAEFETIEKLSALYPGLLVMAYGIHPQNPCLEYVDFLESLLVHNRIQAIGEAGFDFFEERFRILEKEQIAVWNVQLELAVQYKKPLVVHCRRALPYLFRDSRKLLQVNTMVFHSWPGSAVEATSFLNRGINGYFVVGKQILKGNKRILESARILPVDRLLAETDAPYQTLKGQKETLPSDIQDIYRKTAETCGVTETELTAQFYCNFKRAFCISGNNA